MTQLPKVFDNLRGLFNGLNRRAMPMKGVISHLMNRRQDISVCPSFYQNAILSKCNRTELNIP